MSDQNFSSADTSINGNKLPSLYNKVDFEACRACKGLPFSVMDYGCGKFDNASDFIHAKGGIWYGFDPYNRTEEYNKNTMQKVYAEGGVSCVLCANVLNVIDSDDAVQKVVDSVTCGFSWDGKGGICPYFVSVYEGPDKGNGIGRQTGPDQWQRNEKTRAYLRFFPSDAVVKKGVITNRPDLLK